MQAQDGARSPRLWGGGRRAPALSSPISNSMCDLSPLIVLVLVILSVGKDVQVVLQDETMSEVSLTPEFFE